jgi:prepilin-type N-terminal cleavage/methylation domain-containing protein
MNASQEKRTVPRSDSLTGSQLGMTLIEVLVALGILAAVAVVFLVGMETSSRAVMVSQKSVAAESLAKSELEHVKSVTYKNAAWQYQLPSSPPLWDPHSLPSGYGGYSVQVDAAQMEVKLGNPAGEDDGIQKITVIVTYNGEQPPAFTLVGYKVNR